jgi:L-malate glycosyltransferase
MTGKNKSPGGSKGLRILLLGSADVIHTRRWDDYFRRKGHEVMLATLEPSGLEDSAEKILSGFTGINALRYPSAAFSLLRLVRDFRPQVVNAHFVPGYGFLAALVPFARPLVVSAWGSDILIGARKGFLHRTRAKFVLGRAKLVTCDGAVLAGALEELGVDSSRILNVPMGIDPGLFYPTESQESDEKKIGIVSLRRLEPLYDVATLLRAAALLRVSGRNFECRVVGDGSQRRELEKVTADLFLQERVTFTGTLPVEEVAGTLRRADIYVSCSHSDSTSVSLLEAMATGLLPVVTDIPGNREWIEHGRNGLLFPCGDVGKLTELLIQAMHDKELRQRAREENLRLVEEKAVWENNMKIVEDRLQEIAGRRS